MKKTLQLLMAVAFVFAISQVHAQTKTGKILFIRSTGYVGSAVNFRVYVDDSLKCKLKNKTYSIHSIPAGEHTVAASSGGLGSNKKSSPFSIKVEEGKTTYVDVVWANKVYCQEITKNSADQKLKKTKENTACSTTEQD